MKFENQNIEWKKIWKDEFLKSLCAFANSQGGKLIIGMDDSGNIIGLRNFRKLLADLPNKIHNILGITAVIDLRQQNGKHYLEITVEPYTTPISYRGHFYYRSGSTNQELKGQSLENFLLGKLGKKWDCMPAIGFSFDDLSDISFDLFRKNAFRSKRIPKEDLEDSNKNLVEILGLTTEKKLKRAAVITFGRDPEKLVTGAYVKLGYFKSDTELLFQDEIRGSLIEQVEKTIDLLTTKYLRAYIDYDGLTRTENLDYPESALREAVLNALVHKDYSSSIPVQISIYNDWLMIWNSGELPNGWTTDTLKNKHTSNPFNPDIANTFFRAGFIEIWGRGTLNIIKQCTEAGLPEPVFEEKWGGIAVIFKSEISSVKESGEKLGEKLGENEIKIINLIAENKWISIQKMAETLGISTTAVENNIQKLKVKKIIQRIGPAKGGYWKINIQ